jgi:hypothetical protein
MIRFNCPNCTKSFTVDPKHSGKDARCSKCNSIIKIPLQEAPISKSDFANELQIPPCLDEKTGLVQNRYAEHFKERQQQAKEWGNETERKRFWLFDIFLYPMNKAGLVMIAILAGIPLLIGLISLVMEYLGRFNPVVYFWHIVFVWVGFVIAFLMAMYKYWFFGRCILDSAEGGIRVPIGLGDTPGIWELFSTLKTIFACVLFAFLPVVIYGFHEGQFKCIFFLLFSPEDADKSVMLYRNFYLLIGFGIIIFPIAVLSVFIHESIRGLNPILLVKSIYKTFLPYICIVLSFLGVFAFFISTLFLAFFLAQYMRSFVVFKIILICRRFVTIYFAIVLAHILGRFYYKNSERLGWL